MHPSKHGPGRIRRRAIERENAVARGFEIGRARQWPSPQESAAYRAVGLEAELWRGVDRGRKARAMLQQLALDLS
jgi:hypothetical protein